MKNSNFIKRLIVCLGLSSPVVQAGCLTDLGPYRDHYGFAVFPFSNGCDESVTVNLCVKSWPPGSEDPVFNSYSGIVYANDRSDLTNGKWEYLDSYQWTEEGYQSCPFE